MKLLLDTRLLLWAAAGEGLSPAAHRLMEDPANDLLFSAASIWEVAIKSALAKLAFDVDSAVLRRELLDSGYEELAHHQRARCRGGHVAGPASGPLRPNPDRSGDVGGGDPLHCRSRRAGLPRPYPLGVLGAASERWRGLTPEVC